MTPLWAKKERRREAGRGRAEVQGHLLATSQEPWGRTGRPAQVGLGRGPLLASVVTLPAQDPARRRLPRWPHPLDRPGLA